MNPRESVLKLLQQIAEKEKLINFRFDVNSGDLKGDGFTSEILFASITTDFKEKIDIVIKQSIENETLQQKMEFKDVFDNEIKFYEEINELIQKFQESYGVYKPFLAVPKYYGKFIGQNERLLALENLKERGFVLYDKINLTDEIHTTCVLQQYGRTHGVFFAYKAKFPEKFLKLKEKVTWTINIILQSPAIGNMFKTVFNEVIEQLENSDIRRDILDRLKKYENFHDLIEEPSKYNGKYECILHGDCWTNNMMFRYSKNKEQKKLEEVYFLDWQLLSIGTPVFDLAYFIYSSASKEILDNLDRYLGIYHNSLSETVRMFGLDPNEVYPFSVLKEEWKTHARAAFVLPFFIHKIRLMNRDDVVKAEDVKNAEDDHITQTLQKRVINKDLMFERIRNLVEHVYETGVL